jgi:hypothetical protein
MGNAGGKTPMVKKREMDALVAATRCTTRDAVGFRRML